jgi:predicted DNA-binding protein (MmcQ/YjbR family)
MSGKKSSSGASMKSLRAFALGYPEAQEGIACEGTALEKITVKARTRAFLFLSAADAMMKLGDSLPEATELAAKEPARYKVGAHGWVTVTFSDDPPPLDMVERWIDESYRLVAGKQLVAMLEGGAAPAKKKAR